ncbi:MAG: histidine phosphatase family protein [Tepidimonas sp.]|uniref:histidine phosphatase family protein n=1 Tax=Tepidimonas sp. TaxID=2002775 RepID=UPI00298F0828|nr:histidine phosphatase family protein [Tepidimonas sp.]MCS6810726.1 histidine phosphatase family protein [Tepidimonas sp.]MDW8336619.1 histidine phosphatase family protein [Tepidimonas sp.]
MHVTRLIAIRHGETAWNRDARIQGQLDIPLNDTGRWQAQRVAQALRHEPLAAVYSSDLSRARDTAAPLAQALGLPVHTHPGLRERCFGAFQGRTWAELELEHPDVVQAWKTRVPDFAPPGGESLLMLRERVERTFTELAARHPGQVIAVVAHGGVLDILYRAAARVDLQAPRAWAMGNAAIHRVLWTADSGFALLSWGDTRHLEEADEAGPRDEQAAA